MTGATHYIEQFKNVINNREYRSMLQQMCDLKENLKHTSYPLKTIAVFKIKFKPGCEPKQLNQNI